MTVQGETQLDDGARVLVRAHPKLLAAAPPDRAKSAAAALAHDA